MFNPVLFFESGKTRFLAMHLIIDTRNTQTGSSASNEFKIPLSPAYPASRINFIVDWGDGVILTVKTREDLKHTYITEGIYKIKIRLVESNAYLEIEYASRDNRLERLKLLEIQRFGDFAFLTAAFSDCKNLKMNNITDVPRNLKLTDFFNNPFWGCNFESINGLSHWDFKCTRFNWIGYQNPSFNQPLLLNLPTATSITGVVGFCNSFNSPVTINAPVATQLNGLIFNCTEFNESISVFAPNLSDLSSAFEGATKFNKDVSGLFDWTKVNNLAKFMAGKSSANYNPLFYDNLLAAWVNGGRSGVSAGMGTIKKTSAGVSNYNILIARGWTITDGGVV